MSILRKRGKAKLRFRIMNRRVPNKEFKYFKRLFLECLRENKDVEKQLDSYYKCIQVGFFYEKNDPNALKSLREFFKDPNLTRSLISSQRAFAFSKNGFGYIGFFLKYLKEYIEERKYIQNIEGYKKNAVFEELCHLVEQRGGYSVYPESWLTLLNLYERTNRLKRGEKILDELYRDRGHYEVYLMVIKAYPKEWVERCWRYFMKETPAMYAQNYEQWKQSIPIDIVYAKLITDTLRAINVLCVAKRVSKEKLSDKQKKLLDILIRTAKAHVKKRKGLIERDMGSSALSLIDSLDESIFKTDDVFFSVVQDRWKSLHLV